MGPVAVTAPAQGLWDHAPNGKIPSCAVLTLGSPFLVEQPSPCCQPPQTRLVGSGKWEIKWLTLLLKLKASIEYFSLFHVFCQ